MSGDIIPHLPPIGKRDEAQYWVIPNPLYHHYPGAWALHRGPFETREAAEHFADDDLYVSKR